jgi:hypothetical protein
MSSHCLHMSIDRALAMTDDELQSMFGSFASDIRHELEQRKDKGEELIGSEGCEGFDPVTGCPGHEVKEVTNG